MDISELRRDMTAIEEGHWVTSEDLPDLGDIRIRVRGMSSGPARQMFDRMSSKVPAKDRNADGSLRNDDMTRIMKAVLKKHLFMEIDGLTEAGKPMKAEQVIERIDDPALEPLIELIIRAVSVVDARRESMTEDAAGN